MARLGKHEKMRKMFGQTMPGLGQEQKQTQEQVRRISFFRERENQSEREHMADQVFMNSLHEYRKMYII